MSIVDTMRKIPGLHNIEEEDNRQVIPLTKNTRGHPLTTSTRRGRESGSCGRLWTVKGSAPCGRPHRKLWPTDIILSSSHAKKLAVLFGPDINTRIFHLWTE